MVGYSKPRQWKKEKSQKLRGRRDQIKVFDIGSNPVSVRVSVYPLDIGQ